MHLPVFQLHLHASHKYTNIQEIHTTIVHFSYPLGEHCIRSYLDHDVCLQAPFPLNESGKRVRRLSDCY